MERWALLALFITYFAIAFAWRSWRVWRLSGINPYVLPSSDDAQGYVTRAFRAVLITLGAYTLAQACWPPIDRWLGLLPWLELAGVQVTGWLALLASLLWTTLAQAQMGLSWRIGIDTRHQTALVSHGLFAHSRNPIFLAMRVSLVGLFLLRPNALTLVILTAGELLIQLQVRHEEAFLRQQHGAVYAEYCARTPRWL